MALVTPGKTLPTRSEYDSNLQPMHFWRVSDRGGHKYVDGFDAKGSAILIQHDVETNDSYNRRKCISSLKNYVRPIITRYNSFVFANDPIRSKEPEVYTNFLDSVNGHGKEMNDFMANVLRRSQIDAASYILVDTTIPYFEEVETQAQADDVGMQVIFRDIKYEQVPYWEEKDGVVTRAIVIVPVNGIFIGWEVTDSEQRVIVLSQPQENATGFSVGDYVVASVDDWVKHNYGGCPLVRLKPTEFDSQAAPIAENQKEIFNLTSLLNEELFNSTFTQWVATGATAEEIEPLTKGVNRVICCSKQGVTWTKLGSDPGQADSIRESIKDAITELYRTAGVTGGAGQVEATGNVSGIAHAFLHLEANSRFAMLAKVAEDAENLAVERWSSATGIEYPGDAVYVKDYNPRDIEADLKRVIEVVKSNLPLTIKDAAILEFAEQNLALNEEDMAKLKGELGAQTETVSTNDSV